MIFLVYLCQANSDNGLIFFILNKSDSSAKCPFVC